MNCRPLPEVSPRKRGSLEQRIRQLIRRYRAQQRCRTKRGQSATSPAHRTVSWTHASRPVMLLLVLATLIVGRAAAATFESANEDYAAGRYAEAAKGFEQVIAQRGYSAPVLFNLGNAWFQAGQPGRAILNYERALWLAPSDAAIRANLRHARQQAGLAGDENSFWEQVARVLSLDTLAWMLVWSTAIICAVILAGRLLLQFPRRLSRGLLVLALLGACVAGAGLALQWPERDRAVVLTAKAEARIAPAAAAGVLFQMPAGALVRAAQSHAGYTLVHLRDGRSGWVASAAVARVI